MTDPQQLRAIVAAWWEDTFVNDYVIDRSGNYRNAEDCIEDIVVRARAALPDEPAVPLPLADAVATVESECLYFLTTETGRSLTPDLIESLYGQFRGIIAGLVDALAEADEPAAPEGREPTRDELWELWLRLDNEMPDKPAAVAEFWEHARVHTRALCGTPAPAPPADGEVAELVKWLRDHAYVLNRSAERKARRICVLLQRQALVPVAVSERPPGPEDCITNPRTGQGQWCWAWTEHVAMPWSGRVPYSGRWRMMRREWLAEATHWLPAHALPIPQQQQESDNG